MAQELNAGRAYVEVVPSLKDFHKKNAAEMRKAGVEARKAFDDGFSSAKSPAAPSPDSKQSRAKGKESGAEFAGAFDREVRTKVTAALKSLPDAKITADSTDAEREVAKVRASLERLSKQRIGIDVDEATALNRLETLQAKLAEISASDNATIGVKANTTQAALNLDKIRVQAEAVGAMSPTIKVDADTSAAQAKIAALQSGGAVPTGAGVSGLAASVMTLGPALIPGAAAGVGGLAGLGGAAGAGGAGLGVAAFALNGVGDAVKLLGEAQKTQGKTAAQVAADNDKAAAAMAGLSPQAQKFAKFINGMRGSISALQKDAAKGFLPGLQSGMESAGKALAPFKGIIGDFAKEMGDLAVSAGKGLGGKEFQNFFTMVGKEGPATLGTTGRIVGNLAKSFAGLAVAFAPVSKQVLGGLERLTKRLAAFSNEGEGGGLSKFVAYVQQMGPKVAAMLGAVGRAIGAIAVAMAPWGTFVIGAITKLANGIASLPVGVLRALMGAVIGLTLAWKAATVVARGYNALIATGTALKKVSTLWTNRETAATLRSTIATKAKTVATKAAAVAMRLFNAVMRMNPIGLVVTALIALGAGLVLAYKKSETFRRIVDAAWAGVKKAVKVVVDWWTGTAWPAIKKFFTSIGTSMVSAKSKIVGAWDSIKAKVVAVKDWITNTAWPGLKKTLYKLSGFIPVVAIYRNWDKITGKFKAAWNWVKGTFSTWWAGIKLIFTNPIESAKTVVTRLLGATGLRKPLTAAWTWVRDTFGKWWSGIKKIFTNPIESARTIIRRILGATGLQKTFQSARDALGRIWGGLKKKLTSPMVSILKWMNSSFIKKLNGMLGKIKVPFRIPEIGVPKGFAAGGWTGPGSKYQPAGVVHADEYVVNKRSRGKFERDNPGVLDHINATGRMPGYAIGGKVSGLNPNFLKQLSLFNAAAGGRYSVYSGYRSNAHQQVLYNNYLNGNGPIAARPGSSQHNKGLAADLAPSNARDVHGALAKQFGLAFTVPSESWHIEPSNGRPSSGGGGGFSLGSLIPEWVKDTAGWLKKKFANATAGFSKDKFGLAGEMVPPVFTAMKDAVKKRAMSAASVFGIGGGGSGGGSFDFSKIKGATNMALGQGMAASMGWKGAQWTALKELWRRESGWNHLAKNPSSGAYGIPQALPASKMASVMQGGGSDYLTNPRTQMSWGLRYIQGRHRNPAAALAFHDRMNWYADGGQVTPPVFDNGGTLAPGLNLVNNKLGKPEALVRPEQAMSGGATFNLHDVDGVLIGVIRGEIDTAARDADRLARRGA